MRLIVSHLPSYVTVAASSDVGAGASLNSSKSGAALPVDLSSL
jgi:hypothetical protein